MRMFWIFGSRCFLMLGAFLFFGVLWAISETCGTSQKPLKLFERISAVLCFDSGMRGHFQRPHDLEGFPPPISLSMGQRVCRVNGICPWRAILCLDQALGIWDQGISASEVPDLLPGPLLTFSWSSVLLLVPRGSYSIALYGGMWTEFGLVVWGISLGCVTVPYGIE